MQAQNNPQSQTALKINLYNPNGQAIKPYFVTRNNQDIKLSHFVIDQDLVVLQNKARPYIFILVSFVEIQNGAFFNHEYRPIFKIIKNPENDKIISLVNYLGKSSFPKYEKGKIVPEYHKVTNLSLGKELIDQPLFRINPLKKKSDAWQIPLYEKMLFKMGNYVFKVIGVNKLRGLMDLSNCYFVKKINNYGRYQGKYFQQINSSEEVCRICLCNQSIEANDSLVACCRCKGTSAFVHVSCFKEWTKQKYRVKHIKTEKTKLAVVLCEFSHFYCEICKYPLPKILRQNKQTFNLINIPMPIPPFLILQAQILPNFYQIIIISHYHEQQKDLMKPFQEDLPLLIGSNSPSDLILRFSSLATVHSQIRYMESLTMPANFYLRSLDFKHGTFIQASEKMEIEPGNVLEVNDYQFTFE